MLRALLLLLVFANVVFFGWSEGWFDGLAGVRSRGDREPERIANQLHPEAVEILQAGPATSALKGLPTTTSCLEAGPVAAVDAAAAEGVLRAALPVGAWSDIRSTGATAAAAHTYRIDNADAAMAARLASLKLDAAGRVGFSACAKADPAR